MTLTVTNQGRRAELSRETVSGRVSTRLVELDGLCALAVLAVVVFHGDSFALPGGFLGVDVFLVISGFLITHLLLSEARGTGHVRLGAFYARRARRLLPSILVLASVTVAAALV